MCASAAETVRRRIVEYDCGEAEQELGPTEQRLRDQELFDPGCPSGSAKRARALHVPAMDRKK